MRKTVLLRTSKNQYALILGIMLPLVIGSGIYLFGRNTVLLLSWLGVQTFPSIISLDWFRFNLPDGLWLFSLCNLIGFIWQAEPPGFFLWSGTSLLLAVGAEVLQYLQVLPGTFDLGDVFAYGSAYSISLLLFSIPKYHTLLNSQSYDYRT